MKRYMFFASLFVALLVLTGCAVTRQMDLSIPGSSKKVRMTMVLPPLSAHAIPLAPFGGQEDIASLRVVIPPIFAEENCVKIGGEVVPSRVYPAILALGDQGIAGWISMRLGSNARGDMLIPGLNANHIPPTAKVYIFGQKSMIEVFGRNPKNFSPWNNEGWKQFQSLLLERFRKEAIGGEWIATTFREWEGEQFRTQLAKVSPARKVGEALPPIGPLTLIIPMYREFYLINLVANQVTSRAFDPDREEPTLEECQRALTETSAGSPEEAQ